MTVAHPYMLYFRTLRIAYNIIQKNACTTIKRSLTAADDAAFFAQLPERLNDQHAAINEHYRPPPRGIDGWRTLVVLRDPFERLVSAYLDKILRPQTEQRRTLVRSAPNGISFAQFFASFAERVAADVDPHWRPQSALLALPAYDTVLRTESLAADWEARGLAPVAPLTPNLANATSVQRADFPAGELWSDLPSTAVLAFVERTGSYPPPEAFAAQGLLRDIRAYYAADYALLGAVRDGALTR